MTILVATADLFFVARIDSVANIVGASICRVSSLDELMAKLKIESVSKIIIDLEFKELNPVEAIALIKADKSLAGIPVIGYLSHAEMAEIGSAAKSAGCDFVMAKSAFSEKLPELLKA